MAILTEHGMLHLLGYDHMEEEERLEMEQEQRFVMEKLGIRTAAGLVVYALAAGYVDPDGM